MKHSIQILLFDSISAKLFSLDLPVIKTHYEKYILFDYKINECPV